ncbi:MAG: GGDEF domain-containing protein [Bacillota bacterium]
METRQETPEHQKNQLKIRWMVFLIFPLLIFTDTKAHLGASARLMILGLFVIYNLMVSWGILELYYRKAFRWLYLCTDFIIFFVYSMIWSASHYVVVFSLLPILNFVFYKGRRLAFILISLVVAGFFAWRTLVKDLALWVKIWPNLYTYLIVMAVINFVLGTLVKAEKAERSARSEKEETIVGLQDATRHLLEFSRQMQQKASTDSLTGLYNHRYYVDNLERLCRLSRRYNSPLSLLMVDIDFFKKINDK